MSFEKKLLVSAFIAGLVVIVVSTIVIAAPHMGRWTSSGIQASSQRGSYSYNQGGSYGYGFGGCMGGGAWGTPVGRGTYGGGMGYSPSGTSRGYVDFVEVSGILEETHWSYIVLDVDGDALEVYGPSWFWHIINPRTGSSVEVIGELVSTINWYGETHVEITPFELTIEDVTYGNADLGIPVWNQRDI